MRSFFSHRFVLPLLSSCWIWLAVSSVVMLSGCGGSPATNTTTPSATEEGTVASKSDVATVPPSVKADQPQSDIVTTNPDSGSHANEVAKLPEQVVTQSASPKVEKPTEEQIAKWAVPDFYPFRLLACYDGFNERSLRCLAITPDGKRFVTGGTHLMLWNTIDTTPVVDLLAAVADKYQPPILSIAISPDGKMLAAGDSDGHLGIWDLEKRGEIISIEANQGGVTQVAFSPNSEQIATTNYSGEVKLWQASDGKPDKSLSLSEREIERLVFVSDNLLAGVGENAVVWNLENGEQASVLSSDQLMGSGLAISHDGKRLAFSDEKGIAIRDIEKSTATDVVLRGHSESVHLVDFSSSGKWIATFAGDSIQIWEAATGRVVQVIDADGGVTTDLKWLPNCDLLAVTSESGRFRIWGTTDVANSVGMVPLELPPIEPIAADSHKPANWVQLQQVIDLPSFPKLPGAVPEFHFINSVYYSVNNTLAEARQFYRYYLEKAGWTEVENKSNEEGLLFHKDNCQLKVGLSPSSEGTASVSNSLKVELYFAGNYKLQWLPKYPAIEVGSSYEFISSSGYQVKADITDLEVALLKSFHEAGWIAWTRLAVSKSEDEPELRMLDFVQGGSELSAFIGPIANTPDSISVQTSVSSLNKSIPLPTDVSWIECDFSTDLKLAALTKLGLEDTQEFFDQNMASEGWLARNDGRANQDGQAWLPFIRGQQDITIRLVASKDGMTHIFVGDGEQWQHSNEEAKIEPELAAVGIEAADFPIPEEAEKVDYSAHDERVTYVLPKSRPTAAVDEFATEIARLDWVRDKFGVISEEYVYVDFTKGEATIEFRATMRDELFSEVSISGDGLLWQKPLPVPPKRISYETWMTKNRVDFSLDHLDQFSKEVGSIPIVRGIEK